MFSPYGNVVLVTGASSGIGKCTAEHLAGEGFKVYGASRRVETGVHNDLGSGFIETVKLDVCSDDSVKEAVEYVLSKEKYIDILINCAGFGIAGSIEDTSCDEALSQLNTNFFGTMRMCRAVLPSMREHGTGLIVNISSVAGLISIPFQSMYSVSKYSIEALTEALRLEVKPFGIKASIVEPGDTKTGFTGVRKYVQASQTNTAYKDKFLSSVKTMEHDEMNGPGPEVVVNEIMKIIRRKNPPIRKTVGASYKAIVFLKRILPARLVEFAVSKIYS